MDLFCSAVMSGISLRRMTKCSDKVSRVCWHCPSVTWTWLMLWCWFCCFVQLLYCYFQQPVTCGLCVCVCVCVCAWVRIVWAGGAQLAVRPSSWRSGAPVTSGDRRHPTFLFVLCDGSETEGYCRLAKPDTSTSKQMFKRCMFILHFIFF